jgi:DNA-binding transcriptional LysR family regulator
MSRARLRRYFRHGLLPQLMVFEAVARLGGVTRAAGELHLAQPTVSMQLKKLSSTLGVALFEQRGRQLHLTAAGLALRETCQELTALLGRAEERLAPFRPNSAETLRLAAEPEASAVAARLIAAFRGVAHANGRELAASAAPFLGEALLDAREPAPNNSAGPAEIEGESEEESRQWKSRATTTRRRT